jgi:hypothetical protein
MEDEVRSPKAVNPSKVGMRGGRGLGPSTVAGAGAGGWQVSMGTWLCGGNACVQQVPVPALLLWHYSSILALQVGPWDKI